jgi:hypothetical protein
MRELLVQMVDGANDTILHYRCPEVEQIAER